MHLLGAVEALQVGEDGPDRGALSGGPGHGSIVPPRPGRFRRATAWHRLRHVRRHPPAFGHDPGQRAEPVVEQDQFGDRFGRGRARAHRHADVGELERQHVVDPVAGHGHRVPARLQGFDHRLFLVRCHPADDGAFLEHGAERAGVLRQVPRVDGVAGTGYARARRDGAHGVRAVPGDHLERHALRREVGDGLGGVGS